MNLKTIPVSFEPPKGRIEGYTFGGPGSAFEPFSRNNKQEDTSHAEGVFKLRSERRIAFTKIRNLFHNNNKVCCITT